MQKKQLLIPLLFSLLCLITSCNLGSKPISGEWEGKGITFTVCETSDTITRLDVVIPYDGEYLAQMYYNLNITDKKFSSLRSGNSFLGIPEANLEGEFISKKLARGTFNGVSWTAIPKTDNQ